MVSSVPPSSPKASCAGQAFVTCPQEKRCQPPTPLAQEESLTPVTPQVSTPGDRVQFPQGHNTRHVSELVTTPFTTCERWLCDLTNPELAHVSERGPGVCGLEAAHTPPAALLGHAGQCRQVGLSGAGPAALHPHHLGTQPLRIPSAGPPQLYF